MSIDMIISNRRKCKIMLNGYRQFKRMKFIKAFQKMFKQDLILQTMNQIDHYLK